MLKKIRKKLFDALTEKMQIQPPLILLEKEFLSEIAWILKTEAMCNIILDNIGYNT